MAEENINLLNELKKGNYFLTLHARKRMALRNISHKDIQKCGENGTATLIEDGKIKVKGLDLDGVELVLICTVEEKVILITVF
jgi:Domain of unknown function (DUF4258)